MVATLDEVFREEWGRAGHFDRTPAGKPGLLAADRVEVPMDSTSANATAFPDERLELIFTVSIRRWPSRPRSP